MLQNVVIMNMIFDPRDRDHTQILLKRSNMMTRSLVCSLNSEQDGKSFRPVKIEEQSYIFPHSI